MKSNIVRVGISSSSPNKQQTDQFLYENYALSSPYPFRGGREALIDGVPVEILTLSVKKLIDRVMSGDLTIAIASLEDVMEIFRKRNKIPMNEGTQLGYFDRDYQEEVPVIERTGGTSFNEANRFSYADTGEKRIISGRSVPLYDIVFSIDDGNQREDDVSVGVVSRRNMRKIPELNRVIANISQRTESYYRNSPSYKERYPRG